MLLWKGGVWDRDNIKNVDLILSINNHLNYFNLAFLIYIKEVSRVDRWVFRWSKVLNGVWAKHFEIL